MKRLIIETTIPGSVDVERNVLSITEYINVQVALEHHLHRLQANDKSVFVGDVHAVEQLIHNLDEEA